MIMRWQEFAKDDAVLAATGQTFAQAVKERIHVRWLPPFLEFGPSFSGKVRPECEQIPHGFRGRITFSELPAGGGHRGETRRRFQGRGSRACSSGTS